MGATDRHVMKISGIQFGLYFTGDPIYWECEQEKTDQVTEGFD